MSRPQPGRPGQARRPGAAAPQTGPAKAQKGPSLEELRNLPAIVDDGANADLDPNNVSSGKISNETVTIGSAAFIVQDWRKKDGTYPDNAYPEVQLKLGFKRDGDGSDDRLYEQGLKYAWIASFAVSKDGNFVKVRPGVVKEGQTVAPKLRKFDQGVMFLKSIETAGGASIIAKLKSEGAKALVGLRVHVRAQRVAGMPDKQPDVLLVDYIEGITAPAQVAAPANQAPAAPAANTASATQQATPAAPKAATPASVTVQAAPAADTSVDINALAEEALVDILNASEGQIARDKVAAKLINIEKWKTHGQRGAILKALREGTVIANGTKWVVDGTNIILA